MPQSVFASHDHSRCIASALTTADELCRERGARLTPVRRRVLEILLEHHKALGAYDVLDRLRAEELADKPPMAYRALNFLVEQGLAHRVEKLNAFLACEHPDQDHLPAFLICTGCDKVVETTAGLPDHLGAKDGFKVDRVVIEAEGQCPSCQDHFAS